MQAKTFVYDEAELVPDDFQHYPVWVNAFALDRATLVAIYGPFERNPDERARVAYEGGFPYPLLDEDDHHPSDIRVKCDFVCRNHQKFVGYVTPGAPTGSLHELHPKIFSPEGQVSLGVGELDMGQQLTVLPRWRRTIEAKLGSSLSSIFPMTLEVPVAVLPPGVPTQWEIPAPVYSYQHKPHFVSLG